MSLFSDVYYEVARDAEFVLRERGSKFYAYVYGVRVLGSEYTDAVCYRVAVKASVGRNFEQAVGDHYQLTGKLVVG